jgi:hypothetical protein
MDPIVLIVWLLCAIIAGFIGKSKNRLVEGVLWGFFLGIIGIIIIACRGKKEG